MKKSRRNFLKQGSVLTLGLTPIFSFGNSPIFDNQKSGLDSELVEEFVRVSHYDDGKAQKLLEKTPLLINAAQDWKNGDFETAIGAAGHQGLKDLSNYFIAKGARFDIFVMTMLGKTKIVKSLLEQYPNLLHSIGPHGLTLLHHAKQGGEDSEELFDYLSESGLTETFIKTF